MNRVAPRTATAAGLALLGVIALSGSWAAPRAEPVAAPASTLLALPGGDPPASGWPVFVLMHGYGVNKDDFSDLIEVVAASGAAAISVDAPFELEAGRRRWGKVDDPAATHAYLTAELAPLREDPRLDLSITHVGGFSQGGIQSLMLVLTFPETYGGALSVSPAGRSFPETWAPGEHPHPLFLVFGEEETAVARTVEKATAIWSHAELPVRAFSHPGGHHFPANWEEVMGGAVAWILEESSR